MAAWPDLTDYHEALQQPRRSFSDPALKEAAVLQDRFGMPKPATGGNAVVYQATHGKDVWAVRCFLRPITDHAERYAAISAHLAKAKVPYATRFHYLADGIRVKQSAFPIVKMEWVQGALLDRHVEASLARPRELASLRERWRALVRELERAKIAHGDLQHGNVLVQGKKLLLIDYDGMWVPKLAGRKASETGHRAYQHPGRSEAHFGAWLDRFSALAVYLSLLALEKEPKLWEEYYTGDNLVFVREDFCDAGRAPIWGHLAALGPEVKRLAGILAGCCAGDPGDAPRLEEVAEATGRYKKAVDLTETGPIAKRKKGWAAAPPPKGSPLDLARRWSVVWSRPGERVETRWKKVMRPAPVEVRKKVEVLALDRLRSALAISLGIASGAALGAFVSPELGLVAAGSGLVATRGLARRRKVEVRFEQMKPVEQQEKEERKHVAPGLKSAVMALAASADARSVLAVSKLGECGTWEPASDGWRPFAVRLPPFEHAALAQAVPRAALATDRAAVVWELAQGKRVDHAVDPANRLHAIALSPDGARLALGHAQGLVRIVEAVSGRPVAELAGLGAKVSALAFSADGQLVLAGTSAGATFLLRAAGRLEKAWEDRPQRPPVTAVALAGTGQLFASADDTGAVVLFGKDGKRRGSAALASRGVRSLCVCGDGPFALAAGCGDGSVKVIDPATGALAATHAVGSAPVTSLAWARGKGALVAATTAGQVALLAVDE